MTGLRISAGLAILGVACSGLVQAWAPGEPIKLIGGSALIEAPAGPRAASSSGHSWTRAAMAEGATPNPAAKVGELPLTNVPVNPPTFTKIEITAAGLLRFNGAGTPGSLITLYRFDKPAGAGSVSQKGDWIVSIDARIGAGEHEFSVEARRGEAGSPVSGSDVRIAIPNELVPTEFDPNVSAKFAPHSKPTGEATASAPNASDRGESTLRNRAERLALDASNEFTELERRRLSQVPPGQGTPAMPAKQEPASTVANDDGGILFWLQEWLASSNRDYQGKIVRGLQAPGSEPDGNVTAAPSVPASTDGKGGNEQMARKDTAAKAQEDAAARALAKRIEDERALQEAKEAARIATERKREEEKRAAAAADARDAEAARQAEATRQAEAARQADTVRQEQARKQAEAQREAEARRRSEARQAEEQRQREAKAQADATRKAEEERRVAAIAADERRRREAADARDKEAARQAELARQAEAARQAEEQRKRVALAEAKAQADAKAQAEAKAKAEAARKAEEERRAAAAALAEQDERRRQEAAAQETRAQVARAQEAARRDREAKEQAAAAEAERRRREVEQQRHAAKTAPSEPPPSKVPEASRSSTPASREIVSRGLRGGDGTPDGTTAPTGGAATVGARTPPAMETSTGGHVMPERWRRFAELYAENAPRTDRASGPLDVEPDDQDRRGPRRTSMVMADKRRADDDACPKAGTRVTPPGTYVVRTGDSLWRISRRLYRKGALWPVIYRANDAKIDDPDLIFPCQRFEIPRLRRR